MSVRVVARIRPLLPQELDKDVIVRAAAAEDGQTPTIVKIPSPKNEAEEFSFAFHGVYDQATTQEELFNAEVAPHIKSLFQGLDLTLFAYGVTGTGKTHTMRGGLKLADRGVIPRLLSHIFRRGKKIAKDSNGATTVDVRLAYYEIYNDKVYDLLEPPEKRSASGLPLREKDGKTNVVGLAEQPCADLRDFERLYIAANQNRVTAATKLNAHSSRSHAILRVRVTQTTRAVPGDASSAVVSVRESTASAIDLAGSEDNRRTDNGRERLVESAAINKSLFVLSQCVDAISRGEKRIPYRESKMTRILSLGQNNGITVMILNLAPLRSYHLDTLSSLNVSSRAKRIEVREIENEVVFKQLPRSLVGAGNGGVTTSHSAAASAAPARQPLRALTNNAHNIQTGLAAANKSAVDKPIKAFSVYTDRTTAVAAAAAAAKGPLASPSLPQPTATASSRMGPLSARSLSIKSGNAAGSGKRPSEPSDPRPSKLARPSLYPHSTTKASTAPAAAPAPAAVAAAPAPAAVAAAPALSAEQIEAIIERKVAEALAARAQQEEKQQRQQRQQQQQQQQQHDRAQAQPQTPMTGAPCSGELSEDVQRRLDALERRIEATQREDDPRAEGLRCLLLARQHKEVGDDAAALRYYEQALPFFPGQAKLLGKIEKLRAKMGKTGTAAAPGAAAAAAAAAPHGPLAGGGSPFSSPRKRQGALARQKARERAAAAAAAAAAASRTTAVQDEAGSALGRLGDADADADAEDDDGDASVVAVEKGRSSASLSPSPRRRRRRRAGHAATAAQTLGRGSRAEAQSGLGGRSDDEADVDEAGDEDNAPPLGTAAAAAAAGLRTPRKRQPRTREIDDADDAAGTHTYHEGMSPVRAHGIAVLV